MNNSRCFSPSQRKELYLRANKKCQICSAPISLDNFHADHVTPYSLGGPTNLANGQALCLPCNLNKSALMEVSYKQFLPTGWKIRQWQHEVINRCYRSIVQQINKSPEDIDAFVMHAFPASGKTLAQLIIAQVLKQQGFIDVVIVCVPKRRLRDQMVKDGLKIGLKLNKSKSLTHHGFDGIVTTYAAIGYENKTTRTFINAEILKQICKEKKVLIIADECHHLGTRQNWGRSFEMAFSQSVARIMTSGTPFRSDGRPLPWLRYFRNQLDLSIPHAYSYGYGISKWNDTCSALGDHAVTDVVFHNWDGEITFSIEENRDGNIEKNTYCHRLSDNIDAIPEYQCEFDDDGRRIVDRRQLRERIRSARRRACIECGTESHPYGTKYVREILCEANDRLNLIRESHPWASGLIVCESVSHADKMAEALHFLTGEAAVVIHNEAKNSNDNLEIFADCTTPAREKWIIAVDMISEGVNIPHLRVGVYMTKIQSALRWTQILGRVIRVEQTLDWEIQTAHFYQYQDGTTSSEDGNGNEIEESIGIKLYAETLEKESNETHIAMDEAENILRRNENQRETINSTTVEAISVSDLKSEQIYGGEKFDSKKLEPFKIIAANSRWAECKLAYIYEAGGKENWRKLINDDENF